MKLDWQHIVLVFVAVLFTIGLIYFARTNESLWPAVLTAVGLVLTGLGQLFKTSPSDVTDLKTLGTLRGLGTDKASTKGGEDVKTD